MKTKTSQILLILLLGILLSACGAEYPITAAQRKAEGEKYATEQKADQDALDQTQARVQDEQLHQQELENIEYRQNLWAEVQPAMVWLLRIAIWCAIAYTIIVSTALSRGSYQLVLTSANHVNKWLEIRAGVAPIDPVTRIPRTLIFENPRIPVSPNTSTVLGRIQEAFGLTVSYEPADERWRVVDANSFRVLADFTQDKQGNIHYGEMSREAIVHWITVNGMVKSGMFSRTGQVAEAIGNAAPNIPGPPMQTFKNIVDIAVEGVHDELS